MYVRKSLAAGLIISLAIIVLGGCQASSKPEIGWSNQWGNSSGNILEDGYVAASEDAVCYAGLNEAADVLYSLSETGAAALIFSKSAYNLNVVGNQVYFTNGLPGSICRIDIDGTNFKTLVRGEYRNLFVSRSHMAYMQGSNLVVSDLAGEHTTAIASDVRRFLPFDDTLLFITGNTEAGGLYRINPDGTGQECLFDRPIISLCANSEAVYFSVSNDISSFGAAGGIIYQMNKENEIIQLPTEMECWDINLTDKYIFFRNQSDQGALYRMDLDGSNITCLLNENCTNIHTVGNSLVFRVVTTGKGVEAGYYVMEQNGYDLRLFDSQTVQNWYRSK